MKIKSQNQDWINRNVMEILVKEEINKQSSRLPSNIIEHINLLEVATYALNRLPALYASSQQGFNRQKLKGHAKYATEITQAVRRGFAAVQQDLLRYSKPIVESEEISLNSRAQELEEAKQALQVLTKYLPDGKFSLSEITELVDRLLAETLREDSKSTKANRIICESSSVWNRHQRYQK